MVEGASDDSTHEGGGQNKQLDSGEDNDDQSVRGRIMVICKGCRRPYIGLITDEGIIPVGVTECSTCGGFDFKPVDPEPIIEDDDVGA